MLLSAVSVLVVAQSSSEIPEGLMNNPVYYIYIYIYIYIYSDRGLWYVDKQTQKIISSNTKLVPPYIFWSNRVVKFDLKKRLKRSQW